MRYFCFVEGGNVNTFWEGGGKKLQGDFFLARGRLKKIFV